MLKKNRNGITWFEFEKLQNYPNLRHAVISRAGGVSKGPYLGLNLSDTVGDDAENVHQNRSRAFSAINLPYPVIHAHQVHGAQVCAVYKPAQEKIANTDGLVTNKTSIALSIQHADCQAAIFFDPVQCAIACVHSGWKGNCQNIYRQTIQQMHALYGSQAHDLIVCISPSLGPNKAEFIHYKTEFPESFWRFGNEHHHFNLWEVARWQLETEGVLTKNIELAGICTHSTPEHFYSYRRDKLCGRNSTLVWLENGS